MGIYEALQDCRARAAAAKPLTPEDEAAWVKAIAAVDQLLAIATSKPPEAIDVMGKRIMILTPIYRGLNGRTFFTLWRCFGQYGVEKIGLIPEFQTVIHEARNMLVQKALATDADVFIMVDDDLVLPCGSASIMNNAFRARLPEPSASFNALQRIMSHPMEARVIGASYVVKGNMSMHGHRNAGRVICGEAFESDIVNNELRAVTGKRGLVECKKMVGLGFSRIHRSVFEDMAKAAEGRWPEILPARAGGHYGWFQPIGPEVNEDTSFCRRCAALNIKMYLDADLVCGHADGTTIWWPTSS